MSTGDIVPEEYLDHRDSGCFDAKLLTHALSNSTAGNVHRTRIFSMCKPSSLVVNCSKTVHYPNPCVVVL